jgi:cell division protein FtsQ
VDLRAVSDRVRGHPWVSSVRSSRRFPGTIEVHVEEYQPVAVLAFDEGLYYVDADGRPFGKVRSDDVDYPFLTGVGGDLESAHPDLPKWVIHDALWLVEALDERDLIRREQVSEVAFHRARGFAIHTSGSVSGYPTARVLIGLGDYERQLSHLAALLDDGVDLTMPLHVDVAPQRVAIVRPLHPPSDKTRP